MVEKIKHFQLPYLTRCGWTAVMAAAVIATILFWEVIA
jgi:hypothetical protein